MSNDNDEAEQKNGQEKVVPLTVPRTCGTCLFGQPKVGPDRSIDFRQKLCYRLPPSATVTVSQTGLQIATIYPHMNLSDWCWEFRPKPDA